MTEAQYLTYLEGCDFAAPKQVSGLITSTHTNVMFDEKVQEYQMTMPLGAANFFGGFFGAEVWQDGQGNDLVREYATDPYIPFSFSHFVRQVQTCDPNYANECDTDLCQVPEGGRGTLPGIQWFTWGLETPRTCIANIRHIRQFQYWAGKVIKNRALIDERIMYMFYVMAAIQTAGHKLTLNGVRDSAGNLSYVPSTDPRNPSPWGSYNFMQERFPQITNVNDLAPLSYPFLEELARRFELFPQGNAVGKNDRNGDVFEIWYPDDFWQENVLKNPDYMKSLRYTMPNSLFAGYSLKPGNSEIIGNWKFRIMPQLPRFYPTLDGQVIPADTHTAVAIEYGDEYVPSMEFQNAPIGLALMVNGRQGTIMTRPTLSQSGDGIPIRPISSTEPWQFNNAWHPECNKFENQPFAYKRYNMGFRLDDPNAAMGFLFRRNIFAMAPITDCNLAAISYKTPNTNDCPITTIGCNQGKERVTDSITQPDNLPTRVECSYENCEGGEGLYKLRVKRIANQPDYNSLGCACGDSVTVWIYNSSNAYVRQEQAVVKFTAMGFPYGIYLIQMSDEADLADGECIKFLSCSDETYLQANVLSAWDSTYPVASDIVGLGVVLDGPIGCEEGDEVRVKYYSATGLVLGTVTADIAEYDIISGFYRLTSVSPNLKANPDSAYSGAVSIGVSCAESPNVSSSSSGS